MRRGRLLILLGLILALGTAAVVFFLLQSTAPTGESEIERVDVVYAMQPIAEDSPVDLEGQLGIKKVPKEGLSEEEFYQGYNPSIYRMWRFLTHPQYYIRQRLNLSKNKRK